MAEPRPIRARRNIALDLGAEALLGRVGNASQYLSRTITRRSRQWTSALELLRAAGWSGPELVVACEILNGYWLAGESADGVYLASALRTGVDRTVSGKSAWWRKRCQALAAYPGEATALAILVDEFSSGNVACETAVRDA